MGKAYYGVDVVEDHRVVMGTPTDWAERNWPEDFNHENGQYFNRCIECDKEFMGHKRRMVCKKCYT